MDEDPKQRGREYARRLADVLAASSGPAEVTGPDGTPVRVHREPDGTLITESATTGSTATRVWPPTTGRPGGYPPGLPFLPGTTACTSVTEGPTRMRMVQWWSVFDGERAFDQLVNETLDGGWEECPAPPDGAPGMRRQFVRQSAKRVIGRTRASERDFLMWMEADRGDERES